MVHMSLCPCRGIHLSIKCINLRTLAAPFDETIGVLHLFQPLVEVISPFSLTISILRQRLFYINRHLFLCWFVDHIFFSMALRIWCMNFYEFLKIPYDFVSGFDFFLKSMWAHCSKSCFTFSIAFSFCISTPNVEETIWKHMSHYNR